MLLKFSARSEHLEVRGQKEQHVSEGERKRNINHWALPLLLVGASDRH